jgi:hypothetical protein
MLSLRIEDSRQSESVQRESEKKVSMDFHGE